MARLVTKTSKIMHERRTIPVAGSEPVRLACVSDTHSQPHAKTIERLRELAPTAILHGGDIGDLEVLDALAQVAPVYAVRGNIDTRAKDVADVLTIDVGALRILLTHIAVYGPKLRGEVAQLAHREKAQLVVCGHSHVPFIGLDKGVTVFNPGSVGPRRFSLPICLGSITISSAGVKLLHINCETGQPWLPPV